MECNNGSAPVTDDAGRVWGRTRFGRDHALFARSHFPIAG